MVAIAAGADHSVALRNDASVLVWGVQSNFQNTFLSRATNTVAVSAGGNWTVALQADGSCVTTFGTILTNLQAISCGFSHILGIGKDGALSSWGRSEFDQTIIPSDISTAASVAAGGEHSVVLLPEGTVRAWGADYCGQASVPHDAFGMCAISAGEAHTLALLGEGEPQILQHPMSATGRVGATAVFAAEVIGSLPLSYQWLYDGAEIPGATARFLSVPLHSRNVAGSYSVVFSNAVGTVESQPARLSIIPEPFFPSPVSEMIVLVGSPLNFLPRIYGDTPTKYQWSRNGEALTDDLRISGSQTRGLSVAWARLNDTGVYTLWIENPFGTATGEVANAYIIPVGAWGSYTNVPLKTNNVVAVAAGFLRSLVLLSDGGVIGWGSAEAIPGSATNMVAVCLGRTHALGLRVDGTLVTWGSNHAGQTNVPPSATNIIGIAVGNNHSLAIQNNGSVLAWGDGFWGQTKVPPSATNIIAVSAASTYSIALRSDGTVIGWGGSFYSITNIPSSATNIVAIAAGQTHVLALRSDGTLATWGSGAITIPGSATNIIAISAANGLSTALRGDGQVICWGSAGSSHTNVPAWATNVIAASSGDSHTLVLMGDEDRQPEPCSLSRSVKVGDRVFLNGGPLSVSLGTFQWQHNGREIPGATNRFLTLDSVDWNDSGSYRLIMSNAFGQVIGPAINLEPWREPLRFAPPLLNGGVVQIRLFGASDMGAVVLYSSTNLIQWDPILTNSASVNPVSFDAPSFNSAPRFFKATEQPTN